MTEGTKAPPTLMPAAHDAWQAYNAMLESKQQHYGYLENLEVKYRSGGARTLAESAHLNSLLDTHDTCVREFAAAMKALSATNRTARDQLLAAMTDNATADKQLTH